MSDFCEVVGILCQPKSSEGQDTALIYRLVYLGSCFFFGHVSPIPSHTPTPLYPQVLQCRNNCGLDVKFTER